MREILFRGKVADEPDEWVIGYLWPYNKNAIWQLYGHENSKCCGTGQFSVIPETMGQYTGLCDKNGKKIFEGDIVSYIDDESGEPMYFTVIFENGAFLFKDGEVVDNALLPESFCLGLEVAGNIHDNPELLKSCITCVFHKEIRSTRLTPFVYCPRANYIFNFPHENYCPDYKRNPDFFNPTSIGGEG